MDFIHNEILKQCLLVPLKTWLLLENMSEIVHFRGKLHEIVFNLNKKPPDPTKLQKSQNMQIYHESLCFRKIVIQHTAIYVISGLKSLKF